MADKDTPGQDTPEQAAGKPAEPPADAGKVEDTPSSHETSGQFPADEVAATFEESSSADK